MTSSRLFLSAALTLVVILSSSSIGQADELYPPNAKQGGTLVVGIGADPATMNTAITTDSPAQEVGHAIFDSLIIATTDGKIAPSLAESWKVSEDSKTYTFNLRKDVKWHDGVAFTSADVKFTAEKAWKTLHSRNRRALANLIAVDTPDDYTAVFRFSAPYGALLVALGKYDGNIIAKHIFDDGQPLDNHPKANTPVGTGPFKFVSWEKGQSLTVTRNPDYFRKGQPYLDKITFKIIPDAAARALAIEAGEIDLLGSSSLPPLAQMERLKGVSGVTVAGFNRATAVSVGGAALMFNMQRPITGNLKVRQAIADAIDRKLLIDRVMLGNAYEMEGPVGGKWYDDTTVVKYPFDQAKANQLLDEAGYPKKADGSRFSLVLSFDSSRTASPRWAEAMQEQLKAVGINLTLVGEERATMVDRQYKNYDFDMGMPADFLGMGPDPGNAIASHYKSTSIGAGPYNNGARYSSPAMDKLLDDVGKEADDAKRKALFGQIGKLATTDLPYLFLMQEKPQIIYRNTFANFQWADERELDYAVVYQTSGTGTSNAPALGGGGDSTAAIAAGVVLVVLLGGGLLLWRGRSARRA